MTTRRRAPKGYRLVTLGHPRKGDLECWPKHYHEKFRRWARVPTGCYDWNIRRMWTAYKGLVARPIAKRRRGK